QLAGVLFEVGPGHADPLPTGGLEPTADVDRFVVLADLIVLRLIGIEVVLPGKARRADVAVQCRPDTHRQRHGLGVEHGERPGQAEADRADIGVGLVAEGVAASAEELGGRRQLAMDLETDHHLPGRALGAGGAARAHDDRSGRGAAASSAPATWNSTRSPSAGARTCTPTGSPSVPTPNGTDKAGWPERLEGMVQTSFMYMAKGS